MNELHFRISRVMKTLDAENPPLFAGGFLHRYPLSGPSASPTLGLAVDAQISCRGIRRYERDSAFARRVDSRQPHRRRRLRARPAHTLAVSETDEGLGTNQSGNRTRASIRSQYGGEVVLVMAAPPPGTTARISFSALKYECIK
jgi:hypothetical protein